MTRSRVILILIASLLTAIPSNSHAGITPKIGSACSKVNQTSLSNGMKIVCLRAGRKLIWGKAASNMAPSTSVSPAAAPIAKPAPLPSPIATPLPLPSPEPSRNEPSPAPIPTPTPTISQAPPVPPTSFQDLQSHISGIIYGAWLKASLQIQNSTSSLGNLKILVGPNTTEDDPNSASTLALISRLYANIGQVKNLYVVKFSKTDIPWAQQQYESLHPNNYQADYVSSSCAGPNGCDGGNAGINANGDGVILLGQGGNYSGQPIVDGGTRASNGQAIAHEYTHTIQMINAPCRGTGCYGNLPQWVLEGNAEWSGTAARFSSSFSDYLTSRNADLGDQYSRPSSYTSEWLNTYLNPNPVFLPNQDNWAYWAKYDRWNVYAIGLMVNEILVDVQGPDAIMKMYVDVGMGKSFTEAFQQEFGIAWSDACPMIAEAISSELRIGIKNYT